MSRLLRLPRLPLQTRQFLRPASSFTPGPSPPKLPADQQAEFERLQRSAAVSSAFQEQSPEKASQMPPSTAQSRHTTSPTASTTSASTTTATEEEDHMKHALFRGAKPEFKGEVNPKTGEVGGPKNDPLRWGGQGEWSYNGRATDF